MAENVGDTPRPGSPIMAGTVGWSDVALGALTAASAYYGYRSQKKANEQNVQLAQNQMDFQEDMSNTSYQRAVEDMRAAGINPMLTAKVGGASTPGGASTTVASEFAPAMSSAVQAAQTLLAGQQIVQNKAQTDQLNATTEKIRSETMEKNLNTAKAELELQRLKKEYEKAHYETETKSHEFRAKNFPVSQHDPKTMNAWQLDVYQRRLEAERERLGLSRARVESGFFESTAGEGSPYINQLLQLMKGITSAVGGR